MKQTSKDEREILRFTELNGEFNAVGITAVLAARKLADEGEVVIVSDNADVNGIGDVTVRRP